MKHLGDITAINGADIEPVDIVTFGAPCQDLSVAGQRKGMKHEAVGDDETTRSGLFYEAVRIIEEMRNHDRATGRTGELVRCRYAIYENVPGALSSNKGADFQSVLTSLVRVVEPEAPEVPMPDKGWPYADAIYGVGADGQPFSVAWRIHDAQYHGVPQRRKRICVLVDFAGLTAPWILFDPQFERTTENGEPIQIERDTGGEPGLEVQVQSEGLSGDSEPSCEAWKGTAARTEAGAGGAGAIGFTNRGYETGGAAETIRAEPHGAYPMVGTAISFQERAGKPGGGARESLSRVNEQEPCQRSTTSPSCKNPWDPQSERVYGDNSPWHSLNANNKGGQNRDAILTTAFAQNQRDEVRNLNDCAGALAAEAGMKQQTFVASFMGGQGSKAGGLGYHEEVSPSIKSEASGTNTVPDVVHSVHQNES